MIDQSVIELWADVMFGNYDEPGETGKGGASSGGLKGWYCIKHKE
jgi:hypothetical protein